MTIQQTTVTVWPDSTGRRGTATTPTEAGALLVAAQPVIPTPGGSDSWATHVRASIDETGLVTVEARHSHALNPTPVLVTVEVAP